MLSCTLFHVVVLLLVMLIRWRVDFPMGPGRGSKIPFATPMREPTAQPTSGDICQNAMCQTAEGSMPCAGVAVSTLTMIMEIPRPKPDPSVPTTKHQPGIARSSGCRTLLCTANESVSGRFRAVVGGLSDGLRIFCSLRLQ